MRYSFPYSITTSSLIGKLRRIRIRIPDLDMDFEVTESSDLEIFRECGVESLVRAKIFKKLEAMDKADEDIPEPRPLSFYKNDSYDLYLNNSESISLKKIKGKAIILKGYPLYAYVVEENAWVLQNGTPLRVPVEVSETHLEALSQLPKDKNNKVIKKLENELLVTRVIQQVATKSNCSIGPQYTWSEVEVDYEEKNRYHNFEKLFPWLIRLSVITEMGSGVPILTCAVSKTELSVFPSISKKLADETALTQSLLLTLLYLVVTFVGPAANTLNNIGVAMDRFFHRANNFLRCKKSTKKDINEPNCCTFLCVINYVCQFIASIAIIDILINDASSDIQQLNAMTQMAGSLESTIFSTKTILNCLYITFGANQLNDPAMYISLFSFIKSGLTKLFTKKPKSTQREIKSVAEEKSTGVGESKSVRDPLLSSSVSTYSESNPHNYFSSSTSRSSHTVTFQGIRLASPAA